MRGLRGAAARLAAVAWAAGAAGSANPNLQKNGEPKIKHFVTILMENRVRPHHPPTIITHHPPDTTAHTLPLLPRPALGLRPAHVAHLLAGALAATQPS